MSTSSSDVLTKDRKKSAHWSERDTEILINVLLQQNDTARTQDNGFKTEVWREISDLLEGHTVTGGPKTPEACKSRWQRLQRDYKAAREMEAVPGFAWDHNSHKLVASPADWDAVEKQWEAGKFQRLHIPLYNSIALLCPDERIRGTITRSRKSLGSISDASSMLSLSVSSAGPPQTPTLSMPHGHVLLDGSGMQGMNLADSSAFQWDAGDMDAEGEFDASYQMHDGSGFVMAPTHGNKRSHYDPSLLNGPSTTTTPLDISARGHGPKRQRSSQSLGGRAQQMTYHVAMPPSGMGGSPMPSPTGYPTGQHGMLMDPAMISPTTPISIQLQQQQTLPHQPQQVQHRHMHTRSQLQMSTAHPVDQSVSHLPKTQHHRAHPPTPHAHTPPQPGPNRVSHSGPPRHSLPLSPPFDMDTARASPGSGETHFSEAHRRTQAILQLQRESELSDDEVMEIMSEFETNIPAMDTYLALQRDSLRRKYLSSLITRRSNGGPIETGRR